MLPPVLVAAFSDVRALSRRLGNFSDRVMGMGIAWYCTRDLAERVDYYKAPKPSFISRLAAGGGTTVPKWEGPRPGRRSE